MTASGKTFRSRRILALLALPLLALAGCWDEEAERPLHFQKGVYDGPPDQGLSEETLQALRQRGHEQQF